MLASRGLLFALALVGAHARAEDGCVTVAQTLEANRLELWATLKNCLEATVTVSADETTNVVNELPSTVSSPPATARFLVARWRQLDRDARWNVKGWKYRWKLGRPLKPTKPTAPATWRAPFDGHHDVLQGPHGAFSHGPGSQDDEAIDWAMPEGTPVVAARTGVVVGVRDDCTTGGEDEALKTAANYVVLRHVDGTYSEYYHLQHRGVVARLGARVKAGDVLGRSGNTGFSSQPHLHFAVFAPIDGTTRVTFPVDVQPAP